MYICIRFGGKTIFVFFFFKKSHLYNVKITLLNSHNVFSYFIITFSGKKKLFPSKNTYSQTLTLLCSSLYFEVLSLNSNEFMLRKR